MSTDVRPSFFPHPPAIPQPAGRFTVFTDAGSACPPGPPLSDYRHRISVELYQRMADAGLFSEDDPIELMEGMLIQKMTKKRPHAIATDLLIRVLSRVVPDGWYLSAENPITIAEDGSEPEPDLKIVRGDPRDDQEHHPTPDRVGLAIEAADASYPYDRGPKLRVYARAALPIYWIVDLNRRVVEVFTEPTGQGADAYYKQCRVYTPEEEIPLMLDGREVARVAVREILP